MSIDLNWETLTTGPDGEELARRIRDFVHARFQAVQLPRFIKSVVVHEFEFGTVAPEVELRDITDPLPDFYEENSDDDSDEDDEDDEEGEEEDVDARCSDRRGSRDRDKTTRDRHRDRERYGNGSRDGTRNRNGGSRGRESDNGAFYDVAERRRRLQAQQRHPTGSAPPRLDAERLRLHRQQQQQQQHQHQHATHATPHAMPQDLTSPFLGVSTPGILGGASNLHYFQSHLGNGTQTPLAAVAGAHLGVAPRHEQGQNLSDGLYTGRSSTRGSADPYNSRASIFSASSSSILRGEEYRGGRPLPAAVRATTSTLSTSPASLLPMATTPAHMRAPSQGELSDSSRGRGGLEVPMLREKSSVSTLAPTTAAGSSRPPTRDRQAGVSGSGSGSGSGRGESAVADGDHDDDDDDGGGPRLREAGPEDVQAVFRIRYGGDVRLNLTAEILLDYPMPSFAGIPVRLSITGLSFDGVGVLAHMRRRVHFCFLSPEDAVAAAGEAGSSTAADEGDGREGAHVRDSTHTKDGKDDDGNGNGKEKGKTKNNSRDDARTRFGGLLQEIKVDSEIGLREGGKQSLRNVGKVERFVLEQVRRIFEDELVYPSYWTFLV